MIEPTQVTNYHRSDEELEEFMLFCIAVAGHNSDSTARLVNRLIARTNGSLFDAFRSPYHGMSIAEILEEWHLAPYNKNAPAVAGVLNLNLRTCTLHDLLSIHGIGHKTARMFLLHSRPDEELVVLDVHMLRYLREECRMRGIPATTPNKLSPTYLKIEEKAKRMVRTKFPHLTFAEFDLGVWKQMSGRN